MPASEEHTAKIHDALEYLDAAIPDGTFDRAAIETLGESIGDLLTHVEGLEKEVERLRGIKSAAIAWVTARDHVDTVARNGGPLGGVGNASMREMRLEGDLRELLAADNKH